MRATAPEGLTLFTPYAFTARQSPLFGLDRLAPCSLRGDLPFQWSLQSLTTALAVEKITPLEWPIKLAKKLSTRVKDGEIGLWPSRALPSCLEPRSFQQSEYGEVMPSLRGSLNPG